jgi:cell division septum initiation protein DivIVA
VATKTQTPPSRSAARRAAEVVARRAEEFAQREKQLLAIVTDFHAATERAEKVRAGAETKAARILGDAEAKAQALREKANADAAGAEEQAEAAVRRMLEFGESRESITALTSWPAARIREIQRAHGAEQR